ncbi:O-antigen ligase like membrane protein [Frankia sp. AgKG'84/4]
MVTTTLTTRIPRSWVIPTQEAESGRTANDATLRVLTILMFCEIFLQRIALPAGGSQVQIILPITYVCVGIMVWRGGLARNSGRTTGYFVAMTACALSALTAFLRQNDDTSFTSLLLLLATYVPFLYGLRPADARALLPRVLDRFLLMITVLAGLALFQFGSQLVGVPYTDVVKNIVPSNLLMHGFNTSYPVQYGSPLYKSNGFVCLEASFCSQFLGFGIVVCVLRGGSWWRLPMLVLAILSTVSGTGLLLLAFAGVLLAVHKGARFAVTALIGVSLVALIISFTPASSIFAARATETSSSTSSGSLRFVQPYQRTWDSLGKDPATVIFGNGPGYADRDASAFFQRTGLPLNYALVPKLILEYGVLGTILFLAFILTMFVRGSQSFVLSGSVLIFYIVLSGGLLAPVVTGLGLLLVAWFTVTPQDEREAAVGLRSTPSAGSPSVQRGSFAAV